MQKSLVYASILKGLQGNSFNYGMQVRKGIVNMYSGNRI